MYFACTGAGLVHFSRNTTVARFFTGTHGGQGLAALPNGGDGMFSHGQKASGTRDSSGASGARRARILAGLEGLEGLGF